MKFYLRQSSDKISTKRVISLRDEATGDTKAAHFREKQSYSIIARCDLPLASKVSRSPSWKVAKFVANLVDASCSAWRALSSLPLATSDDVHRNAKPRARQSTGGSTFPAICSAPACDRCTRKRWEFLSAGKCIPCTPPNSRYFRILIFPLTELIVISSSYLSLFLSFQRVSQNFHDLSGEI